MGIYSARKYFYETKKTLSLKTLRREEGIFSIGVDAEYAIGSGRDLHLEGEELTKHVMKKYVTPYLKNGINVFMVFGGKQIKYQKDVKTSRINDKLKWRKSVFKSYTNQEHSKVKEDILNFIWEKVSDYFNTFPPNVNHPLYNLYIATFVYCNPSSIMNRSNYKYYMTEVGKYVWKSSDPIYALYENFIVNKQDVTLGDIPRTVLWELSYKHWQGKMAQKRLVDHIEYVKAYLKNHVPVVKSTYDGDDQLAMMVELGIINAIVSGDSDFFAFNSNMVIVGIDKTMSCIEAVKLSDMYSNFENKGYTYNMVRTAMIVSTADYNPEFYKFRIPFRTSLKECKTAFGYERSYFDVFKYFCQKHNILYDKDIAEEISRAYTLSSRTVDIIDSIQVIIDAIIEYTCVIDANDNVETRLYMYFIKVLLLSVITNTSNLSCVKNLNYGLNMSNKITFSSIKDFIRKQQVR